MSAFLALVGRDLRLGLRQGSDAVAALAFYVLAILLFPFGVGPEPNTLARIAPGVLWAAALLASLMSLERLFQADYEDGSLEQLALSPLPLPLVALAKMTAHMALTGLPVALLAPALAVMLNMPTDGLPWMAATLALGAPTLSLIGGVGAALTIGARRGGVLLALLTTPLFVPVLIFGAAAVEAALAGLSPRPHLLFLGGLLAAALPLAPLAAGAALRQALE